MYASSNPALTADFVDLHCPSWARIPHCSFESHLQICLLLSLTVLSVECILLSFQSPQPATSHTNTRVVNTWCCCVHLPKHINKTTYLHFSDEYRDFLVQADVDIHADVLGFSAQFRCDFLHDSVWKKLYRQEFHADSCINQTSRYVCT